MSQFTHGTRVREQESKIKGILAAKTPTVIVGTATINQGDISCVNKPVLIQSAKDAATYFGGTNNIKGFSINEALYLANNVYNTYPIICINILDPENHKTAYEETDVVVVDGKAKLGKTGIITGETLIIKNTDNLEIIPSEKYDINFDAEGKVVVKINDDSVKKINANYDFLDVSKVQETDVMGSINPKTLEAKGLELIKEIFPKFSMIPGCVIAPDFATAKIALALDAKANVIDNKWGSFSIPEIPNTTKYGDVIDFKKKNNYIDEDQIIVFGVPYIADETFHASTVAALIMQSVDAKNDGVPFESPSNKNCKMHGIGYFENEVFKKLNLSETEANLLNENGISTILSRSNGTVFWGNRTSVFQPGGNMDPKDMWITHKRMFKYIGNTIMLNNENEVDKPMTPSRCKSIETNINTWLTAMTNEGKLLGGRAEFLPEENPQNDLVMGKFKWHIYLGIITPGETLEFILEYDGEYLNTLFK